MGVSRPVYTTVRASDEATRTTQLTAFSKHCHLIMGNYSSKLFTSNILNDIKVNEHNQLLQESHITSVQVSRSGENLENFSNNDGITQTPIKKNSMLESRKRISAIPEHLQTEKTRKPYLETDLDCVSTTEKLWLDPRSPSVAYPRTPILLQNNLNSSAKNTNGESFSKLKLSHAELKTNTIDLDPRSPASDFDRTPISAVKISKQFNTQCSDNANGIRKSNSSLDICIKLSYCETTSLFNIPEIQALPDIVVSLRRSCSLKDNLNKNSTSSTTGDANVKSELISDNLQSVKLHVSKESSMPNLQEETESVKHTETKNEETEINEKHVKVNIANAVSENNIEPTKDLEVVNKAADPEEKFKIWRDSFSKLPENSCVSHSSNSQKNLLLAEKEKILIEFDDDCSITNKMRSNQVKKIEKMEGFVKENKLISVDKKNLETKRENKFLNEKKWCSPDLKNTGEFSKNRTPFTNRSNSNGQIPALSVKSPEQFLGNRKLFMTKNKKCLENTPPPDKKRVKNAPAKLNGTQWDSDSTIII